MYRLQPVSTLVSGLGVQFSGEADLPSTHKALGLILDTAELTENHWIPLLKITQLTRNFALTEFTKFTDILRKTALIYRD